MVMPVVILAPLLILFLYVDTHDPLYILSSSFIFLVPAGICFFVGLAFKRIFVSESRKVMGTKHAMISVALGWLIITLICSLPFYLSGTLNLVDSFFESMSGFTTTGMTMIKDIESCSRALLFYRSLTQWIGGVGIIILALSVLTRPGTVAMKVYASELGDLKIKPRMKSTIRETWKIYVFYTIMCAIWLCIAGMGPFDAINHSLTTLPTGGFSTHSDSIAFYNSPLIESILVMFMFISSISFILHFELFRGNFKDLFKNIEFRYMLVILLISISFMLLEVGPTPSNLRASIFQLVSIMTTTGFTVTDIGTCTYLSKTVLFILMLTGGFYASTASGMKLFRIAATIQIVVYNIKKIILPRSAVIKLKIGDKDLDNSEIISLTAFLCLYFLASLIGAMIFMALGYEAYDSTSVSISAISNVGPCYIPTYLDDSGTTIPNPAWFDMPDIGKITLIALMWIGRLEIFPVLILLSLIFMKKRTKK